MAEYVGFTEMEVRSLCENSSMNFEDLQAWYDGYSFSRVSHVYNPNSVMTALREAEIQNYWTQTETFESLKEYISMNFDGLKEAIICMLGGEHVGVKIRTFQNDITSFENKNDVLTLLIHLGYLAYDSNLREAYIPNMEVAEAFEDAVSGDNWGVVGESISNSERLLQATLDGDEKTVADALEVVHESVSSVLQYNNGISYCRDATGEHAKRHSCVIERA